MKRLAVGIVTLAIIVGSIWWSVEAQTASTEALLADIKTIEAAFYAGDTARCDILCKQFPEMVKQHTKLFPLITTHEELHALEETAACLPVLYAQNARGAFSEELARCKQKLEQLCNMEKPLIENIF